MDVDVVVVPVHLGRRRRRLRRIRCSLWNRKEKNKPHLALESDVLRAYPRSFIQRETERER